MVEQDFVSAVTDTLLQIPYHKHKLNPILVHYIYHKNEKGKPSEMDLPLLKNDITNILRPQKPAIYSRTHNCYFLGRRYG